MSVAWAQETQKSKPQLSLGDRLSIYSEKAYRKDEGNYFEAVGNVVIISGSDTIYGQKASFNMQTGLANIEGNVRFIGQGVTLYGSQVQFNSQDNTLELKHARIITDDFSIIADSLRRVGADTYEAIQAEFTTCKDCTESWTIAGEKINIQLGRYIQMYNAQIKVKGINLLYIPYVALPIKNKRESGLLFPMFYTRNNEGFSYKQPVFWNISDSKDMTITPGVLGKRGYALDTEYRQMFGEQKWMEYTHFLVNDNIYLPGKDDFDTINSSDFTDEQERNERRDLAPNYFRNFGEVESHMQWNNDLNQHLRFTQSKDLDFMTDFPMLVDKKVNASDLGFQGHLDQRFDLFSVGMEGGYRTNLLVTNAEDFDDNYVQVMPKVYLNSVPVSLYQSNRDYLQYMTTGINSDFTVFKQNNYLEDEYIRNATRMDARPYLELGWFSIGALSASTNYQLQLQEYQFHNYENTFQKSAGIVTTEFAFEMDRIFGIAYEKEIPLSRLSKESAQDLASSSEKNKVFADKNFIGDLPSLQSFMKDDMVTVRRNSYRHSQEFKIVHYMLAHSSTSGNERFENQISQNHGWFDYQDAIQSDLSRVGANATRTALPKQNTLELQWNNNLVKKSPRTYDYFKDNEYLRDHFAYKRIGFFKFSQGLDLTDQESQDPSQRLTRMLVHTGYNLENSSFDLKEYFFHQEDNHIFNFNIEHRFEQVSLLTAYDYNSFEDAHLKTIKGGVQYRPIDSFGISLLREYDLDADQNVRSIYQFDVMPHNNCWIFNVNFRDSVVEKRVAFNVVFNFGDEAFSEYRTNFFKFNRLY